MKLKFKDIEGRVGEWQWLGVDGKPYSPACKLVSKDGKNYSCVTDRSESAYSLDSLRGSAYWSFEGPSGSRKLLLLEKPR